MSKGEVIDLPQNAHILNKQTDKATGSVWFTIGVPEDKPKQYLNIVFKPGEAREMPSGWELVCKVTQPAPDGGIATLWAKDIVEESKGGKKVDKRV